MKHANDIFSRINTKEKFSLIKPLTKYPDESSEPTLVPCTRCNNAGWTRKDEYGAQTGYRSVLVPCPACIGGRRAKQSEVRQAQLVERLFGGSQIPYKAETWTFESYPREGDQHAKALVEHFVGNHANENKRGLYLSGHMGRGKTGLAICALKAFIRMGYLSLFVSTPDLMDRLRATFGQTAEESQDELLKVITEVPFLVLDDMGVEKPTTYVLEKFYLIVDKRQSRGLYTVFTSNMSTSDLEAYWRPVDVPEGKFHAGMRIVERIREYCSGVSFRGGNLRELGW
jgi:DNA replication protein DnaC